MKKIITALISAAFVTTLLFGLTACYVSKPDTMENLVGTYELASYTHKAKDAPEGTEATDKIKEDGIVAYLIIKSNGTGYYVYKDNDTETNVRPLKIDYRYDEDDPSRVKEIYYYDGSDTSHGDGYPGRGFEHLGLTFGKKEKKLDYSMPAVFGRTYSQSVTYKKVSDKSDLSYASSKLKTTLTAPEYELSGLERFYATSGYCDDYLPYVYYVLDFHPTSKTADLYYMLKSDEVRVAQKNLPVSWTYSEDGYKLNMRIGDITAQRNVAGYIITRYLTVDYSQPDEAEALMGLIPDATSAEELITNATQNYQQQKADAELQNELEN